MISESTTGLCRLVSYANASLRGLDIRCADLSGLRFQNVNIRNGVIKDADLSHLEIDGAQMGGALIHHIGLPPEGHPAYAEGKEQLPLTFLNCDLRGSLFADCDLRGVSIRYSNCAGMKIDGIDVGELLRVYRDRPAQASNGSSRNA